MQSKVTQEDFVRLPYNRDAADGSIRPSQSYWRSVLRRLVKNRVAMVSAAVILLIVNMLEKKNLLAAGRGRRGAA